MNSAGVVSEERESPCEERESYALSDWSTCSFIDLSLLAKDENALQAPDLVSRRAARQRTRFDEPDAMAQPVSPNSVPRIK